MSSRTVGLGPRPGLAKTSGLPLVSTRRTLLARGNDGPIRDLFDRADVVSEGAVRSEDGHEVWFGSTSILLLLPPTPAPRHAFLAAMVERDVHLRLRALRMAQKEASLRAPMPLSSCRCDLRVQMDPRGLRIDVDVEAPMMGRRRTGSQAPTG